MSSETLWKVYGTVNEWVRFTDAKAAAILAADGVLAGFAASLLKDNRAEVLGSAPLLVCVGLGLGALGISVVYCVNCISPSLGFLRPKFLAPSPVAVRDPKESLIFFGHVAALESAGDYALLTAEAFSDEAKLQAQLSQQVWANARVCLDKNKQVAWAVLFLSVALVLGALALGIGFVFGGKSHVGT
jgi:hypothetical protein